MCLKVGFTYLAPGIPQVVFVLRLIGHEAAIFAGGRRQNVLADKRDRLISVLTALTGFTHPSLMGQSYGVRKPVGAPQCPRWVELPLASEENSRGN